MTIGEAMIKVEDLSSWCRVYAIDKPQQAFGANAERPKVKIKYFYLP